MTQVANVRKIDSAASDTLAPAAEYVLNLLGPVMVQMQAAGVSRDEFVGLANLMSQALELKVSTADMLTALDGYESASNAASLAASVAALTTQVSKLSAACQAMAAKVDLHATPGTSYQATFVAALT